MSTPTTNAAQTRQVLRIVRGQATSDGAGVKLNRVIGGQSLPQLDPFLLLDEFRTDDAADYIAGFPDHPHRGFETVTYMIRGRMRHGDNQGNAGLLTAGSIQWMTAGRGIVHSEMPEQEQGAMQGFQLWVNLPAKDKMIAPRYQDIAPESVPEVDLGDGSKVRVLVGHYAGVAGPVTNIATDPTYLDVHLAPGARFQTTLVSTHNAFVYIYQGIARLGAEEKEIVRGDLAVLGEGAVVLALAGEAPCRLIVVAGRPLNEPIARYGPFVMNTREEIAQAVNDFNAGRF